jgi:acetoin utilization deacetylase AcuC-like enzyme
VAIAAKYLLKKFKLKKIAILDIDSHHGNGTQEIFYETNKVLYISLHEDPRIFPGTGFIDEIGEAEGLGYNVNIPLPFKTGDQIYLKAIKEIAVPIMQQYKPHFILVSVGLDGHYTDPVGSLSLSALCYKNVYSLIVKLASEICDGRLVSVLEGGYSRRFVGKIAAAAIGEMSQFNYEINDKAPLINKQIVQKGRKILEKVTKVQSNFWDLG